MGEIIEKTVAPLVSPEQLKAAQDKLVKTVKEAIDPTALSSSAPAD